MPTWHPDSREAGTQGPWVWGQTRLCSQIKKQRERREGNGRWEPIVHGENLWGPRGRGEKDSSSFSGFFFFFHFQKVEIFVTIVMIWKEKRKKWKSVIFRKTAPKSLSTTHLCWSGSLDYAEFTRSKPRKAEQYSVFLSHFLTYKTRLYELRLQHI